MIEPLRLFRAAQRKRSEHEQTKRRCKDQPADRFTLDRWFDLPNPLDVNHSRPDLLRPKNHDRAFTFRDLHFRRPHEQTPQSIFSMQTRSSVWRDVHLAPSLRDLGNDQRSTTESRHGHVEDRRLCRTYPARVAIEQMTHTNHVATAHHHELQSSYGSRA